MHCSVGGNGKPPNTRSLPLFVERLCAKGRVAENPTNARHPDQSRAVSTPSRARTLRRLARGYSPTTPAWGSITSSCSMPRRPLDSFESGRADRTRLAPPAAQCGPRRDLEAIGRPPLPPAGRLDGQSPPSQRERPRVTRRGGSDYRSTRTTGLSGARRPGSRGFAFGSNVAGGPGRDLARDPPDL